MNWVTIRIAENHYKLISEIAEAWQVPRAEIVRQALQPWLLKEVKEVRRKAETDKAGAANA